MSLIPAFVEFLRPLCIVLGISHPSFACAAAPLQPSSRALLLRQIQCNAPQCLVVLLILMHNADVWLWHSQGFDRSIGKVMQGGISVEKFLQHYGRGGRPVRPLPTCVTKCHHDVMFQ